MRTDNLPSIKSKAKKRVGRGYGSGRGGHTSSRGQKGQRSRNKIHPLFEGTKTRKSLIQRLPLQRGKSKNKSLTKNPVVINVESLSVIADGARVTVDFLIEKGLVGKEAKKLGVKILGSGKLEKKLTVEVPVSASAGRKIVKAGGDIKDLVQSKESKEIKTKSNEATPGH